MSKNPTRTSNNYLQLPIKKLMAPKLMVVAQSLITNAGAQKRAGFHVVWEEVKGRRGERANLKQRWQQKNGKNLWLMEVNIRGEVAESIDEVVIVEAVQKKEIVVNGTMKRGLNFVSFNFD